MRGEKKLEQKSFTNKDKKEIEHIRLHSSRTFAFHELSGHSLRVEVVGRGGRNIVRLSALPLLDPLALRQRETEQDKHAQAKEESSCEMRRSPAPAPIP